MKKHFILKVVLIVMLFSVAVFFSSRCNARVLRDNLSSREGMVRKAIRLVEEDPRYKNLGSVLERRVGEKFKIGKVNYMLDIFNMLENLIPLSYQENIESRIKQNSPQVWRSLLVDKHKIEIYPEEKFGIVSNWLWETLSTSEKNIFRAAGAVIKVNPKKLLYEYISEVNFSFILASACKLSDSSIRHILSELNLNFDYSDQELLRATVIKTAQALKGSGFDLEEMLPLVISLSSKNSEGKISGFKRNLIKLYETLLEFDEASIDAKPILTLLLSHTQKGNLESGTDSFRNTYLNRIKEFVFSIKNVYSEDLVEVSLNLTFDFSSKDAYRFDKNLTSFKKFILELDRKFTFSLDSFFDILAEIEKITKDEPLHTNISSVRGLSTYLNRIGMNPNKELLNLIKPILSISFKDGRIFRTHINTLKGYFLEDLIGEISDLDYYLKKWIPEFAKKVEENIDEKKLRKEEAWKKYRYSFILSLKNLLLLSSERDIYTQSTTDYILEKSLEWSEELRDFPENIKSTEFLIKKLTSKYPSNPSFLRDLIYFSLKLSQGVAEDYRLNCNSLESLIEKLNSADIPSTPIVKSLIRTAESVSRNSPKIYRGNLAVIKQFIEDITPYKERLQREQIIIEEILKKEILKIAKKTKDDYLRFRQEIRNLKERLVGP